MKNEEEKVIEFFVKILLMFTGLFGALAIFANQVPNKNYVFFIVFSIVLLLLCALLIAWRSKEKPKKSHSTSIHPWG